jgi:hypothetical protein
MTSRAADLARVPPHLASEERRTPLTPAERQARRRERVRDGLAVVPVAVDLAMLEDALTADGYLTGEDADDREKLKAAFEIAVKDWIEQRLVDTWTNAVTRDAAAF